MSCFNNNVIIYSIDLNIEMLNESKKKFSNQQIKKIQFIHANAEKLPFKNNFFDKYVISFCLRNITYIDRALKEALRILKPGGSFYCLEFSTPTSPFVNEIYSLYKSKIIPLVGSLVAKNKNAYKYLDESITQFPNQKILLSKLEQLGFKEISITNFDQNDVIRHPLVAKIIEAYQKNTNDKA